MLQRVLLTVAITGIPALATAPVLAAPSITIEGLEGAEHWVWIEAEHAIAGTGTTALSNSATISGQYPGSVNYYTSTTAIGATDFVEWSFTAPVAMSSNTKLYLRADLERSRRINFFIDGELAASRHMAENPDSSLPSAFLATSSTDTVPGEVGLQVGEIAAGNHTLRIEKGDTLTLNWWRFDGILLYDGNPVLPMAPENLEGGGRNWLMNPSSASSPVIGGPVTPVIHVSSLDANDRVEYRLNGAVYTPGTEIGPGTYELVVYVLDEASLTSDRIAFSGANFTIVPEPGTVGLVVTGLLAGFLRRHRKASEGNPGPGTP